MQKLMENRDSEHLAIIGSACVLPAVLNRKEYWNLLINECSPIQETHKSRFDDSLYYDQRKNVKGKSFTKIASLLDLDRFRKNVEPDLITRLANQNIRLSDLPTDLGHRISLFTAYQSFLDAGYSIDSLKGGKIGVLIGLVAATDQTAYQVLHSRIPCYIEKLRNLPGFDVFTDEVRKNFATALDQRHQKHLKVGNGNRISPHDVAMDIIRCFQLRGIGLGIDSACSSSLMTIALAGDYLRAGKLDAAIVGGISWFSFGGMIHYSNAQAASGDGSRPFDEGANGFIPGEGCAYAVIKTLSKAVADGDRILGVIRGLGISSDGKGKGLWAPRKEGQTLAVHRAYRNQNLTLRDLDYIEAHATSTTLGDATELNALMDAYADALPDKVYLTSHKANIGHVFEAAGMAGIIKVLMAMQHETIPPQIHFQKPTSEFDWKKSPFTVPTEPVKWVPRKNAPRRAGVNAFGIGGLNGHIVLEEPSDEVLRNHHAVDTTKPVFTKPIAVIGMGTVLPGAFCCDDFRELLRSGRDVRTPIPENRNDLLMTREERTAKHRLKGGFVEGYQYDWKRHKIPPNRIAKANPLQFMMLGAVDEAIENAGLTTKLDKEKTAVVAGTRSDSDFLTVLSMVLFMPELRDVFEKTLQKHALDEMTAVELGRVFADHLYKEYPSLDDETGGFTISTLASRVTKAYDLMGGAVAIDGGLSGGMIALENAMLRLQNDEIDTVICVAGHRAMGHGRYEELRQNGILSQNMRNPLSHDADGIVPGEGACAVVLQRLEDARKNGNPVRGILHAVAGTTSPDNSENAAERAMTQAHLQADVSGERISFCGFTCSGAPERDRTVLNVLAEKIGSENRNAPAMISSEIGQIGHTGPTAGLVSVIRTLLEMERLESFGNAGLTQPNNTIRDNADVLRCESSATPHPCRNADGRVFATVTNVDPCGMVYHAVLERGTKVEMPVHENHDVPMILSKRNASKTQHDKVAFLFPGQGAQKIGMLRKLAAEYEPLAERIGDIDTILADLKLPTWTDMVWENGKSLGRDVLRTQLSLLAADSLLMSLLEERGLVPDMILGHSYGEYPALVAAGAWSFETAVLATAKRCEAIIQSVGTGTGMLSTRADETVLHRLFDEIGGRLYVSNRNSREQTIVSGENVDLKKLESCLKRDKIPAIILPVPAAFHSPWVEGVCEPLKNALSQCPIRPPHHLLLSSIGTRFVADPEQIRENLVRQMVEPVDFVGMMERAYENECRVFVEVGPRKILTNLGRNILAGKDDVTFLTCDDGKEGSLEQFDEVCRFLENHRINYSFRRSVQWRDGETDIIDRQIDALQVDDEKPQPVELPEGFRYFELSGSPYEMGFDYGCKDVDRIRATLRRYADVAMQPGSMLPDTNGDMKHRLNTLFTREDLEELRGMADGAKVPFDALLRHNLSAFPERDVVVRKKFAKHPESFNAGCMHFAGKTKDGAFVHGGNLDLPLVRMLHGAIAPALMTRRYAGKIPYVSMGIAGRLGSVGGFNRCGICVSSCVLLDVPRTDDNTCGLLHPNIVTRVLSESETLEQAVEIVRTQSGTGGWTMVLSDLASGRMIHIEYDGNDVFVSAKPTAFMQANHALSQELRSRGAVPSHSINRLKRLESLLNVDVNGQLLCDSDATFRALRDTFDIERNVIPEHRTMNSILRIDNTFSWQIDTRTMALRIAFSRKPDTLDCESNWKTVPLRTILPDMDLKLNQATSKQTEFSTIDYDTFLKRNLAVDGKCPVKLRDTVAERFVNRMVETEPLEDVRNIVFPGTVLVYGGADNPVADLLEERIRSFGGKTFRLARWHENGQSAEELDKLWNESPFYTLFLLNSYDRDAVSYDDHAAWEKRFEQGVIGPTFAAQYIYSKLSSEKQLAKLELFAATRLGGDYGISSQIEAVEGAGNNGIVKAVFIEAVAIHSVNLHARTIDHRAGAATETVVQNLLNEYVDRHAGGLEVGYFGNRRFLCRMLSTYVGAEAEKAPGGIEVCDEMDLPEWIDNVSRQNKSSTRPAWIITGGARGICAEIAYAIAQSRNAKLYLIGSSPILHVEDAWRNLDEEGMKTLKASIVRNAAMSKSGKPIEAWEKINKAMETDTFFMKLNEEGIPFEYFSCDVTDSKTVEKTIADILTKEKNIEGFVHGAGFEYATRIEKKKSGVIRKTIAIKVNGAFNILKALGRHEPQYVIGMGSISARLGASGQLDYVTANELLSKLLADYADSHPRTKATTINWTVWDKVGMAVRQESRMTLQTLGLRFLPPQEAISFFLSELQHSLNENEVTVLSWDFYKQFFFDETCYFPRPNHSVQENVTTDTNHAVWRIDAEDFRDLNFTTKEESPFDSGCVAPRYVVRMMQRSLVFPSLEEMFDTNGSVLLIGENEIAARIREKLQTNGLDVVTMPDAIAADEVEEYLKTVSHDKSIIHVICLDSYDPDFSVSSQSFCEKIIDKHVLRLIMACRSIVLTARERNMLDRLTFTAATRFGGTFGLTGNISMPMGAAASGLFKAINDELRVRDSLFVPVRIVDHDSVASQDEIVFHLYDEIRDVIASVPLKNKNPVETLLSTPVAVGQWSPHDIEVGYKDNVRHVARTVPLPLEPLSEGHPFEKTVERVSRRAVDGGKHFITPGGTWIVVGGLRGITNACAEALADVYRPRKIIAVGSSPYEEVDAEYLDDQSPAVTMKKKQAINEAVQTRQSFTKVWSRFTRNQEMTRNMNKLRRNGTEVEYRVCDMRSCNEVSAFVDDLDKNGENVTGVINGAMYCGTDHALEEADLSSVQNGLNTKIVGNIVLLEKLARHPLEFYVGFGSVSGRFGGNGQTIYTATNDCLVKLLAAYRRKYPNCRFWCAEWGAWSQVGVSWRPNFRGLHMLAGSVFISPEEGTRHFLREFEHGLPELESLFVAWKYYKRFQPNAIHDLSPTENVTTKQNVSTLPTVMGNNADARAVSRLGLNDCLIFAHGRDLEGLPVVPTAKRNQWYADCVAKSLTVTEEWFSDPSKNGLSKIIVLTAAAEIPDGRKIIERMKRLENASRQSGHKLQFAFVDLPLDVDPLDVANMVREIALGEHAQNSRTEKSDMSMKPILVEQVLERSPRHVMFQVMVDPEKDTFLLEHRIANRPILPVVMAMEMMAEAAMLTDNLLPLKAIRNLKIHRGMSCTSLTPYRLTVTIEKTEPHDSLQTWSARITGDYYNPKGVLINEKCPYFSGELVFGNRDLEKPNLPVGGRHQWVVEYPDSGTFPIYHGRSLRGLQHVDFDDAVRLNGKVKFISQESLFHSRWNETHDIGRSVVLNPSLIDACLYASGVLHGIGNADTSILPDYFEEFEIGGGKVSSDEVCSVFVEAKGDIRLPMGYRNMIFDFVLCNGAGEVVYRCKGFRATEVSAKKQQS